MAVKPCNSGCIKKETGKPNEFSLGFGFSEVVGRLSVGFGERNYELTALSTKLSGTDPKRYVQVIHPVTEKFISLSWLLSF